VHVNSHIEAQPGNSVRTARQEWRAGWTLVLAATLGVAVCTSYVQFVGAMIKPLQEAYGWGRGEIAFGLTLITLLAPVSSLCAGALADHFGPRRLALWGSVGFGVGFCAWGLAGPSQISWYLLCLLFTAIGQLANSVVWTMMVVRNFHSSRGLALALTLCGGGIAVGFTPMIVVFLHANFDVRSIFFIWGAVGGATMLVSTWLFFREPAAAARVDSPHLPAIPATLPDGHSLRQVFRDRNFWQFAFAILCVALAVGTFYVHMQPMLQDSGFTPELAASVAMVIAPSLICGRILIGTLLDRFECRFVSAVAFLFPAIACLLLTFLDGSYALAIITGVVIGLGLGAEVDIVAYMTSHFFGTRNYGKIFAILSGLYGAGIGIGSTLAGHLFDLTGTYKLALFLMAASAVVSVFLVASLGRPKR
jgi:MFS family permease